MSRYTTSYKNFLDRIDEITIIYKIALKLSQDPLKIENAKMINALCRSGVVLLSSHIEGYIEELGEIALENIHVKRVRKGDLGSSFNYYLNKKHIEEIKSTQDPQKISLKIKDLFTSFGYIWNSEPYYSNRLPTEEFLSGFSNPNHARIKQFFKYFGYDNFHSDLCARLLTDSNACINMIDYIVELRNKIAHGDISATSTPVDLQNMIHLTQRYCRETDHVVGGWFRNIGCMIR